MTIWTKVKSIPRGPAIVWRNLKGKINYLGGRPRCPKCLSWKCVDHNGHKSVTHYQTSFLGFHCNRCNVWWIDSNQALCFICDSVFDIPESNTEIATIKVNEGRGVSYHHNVIDHPFCPKCELKVGNDRSSNRSGLRKLVGV